MLLSAATSFFVCYCKCIVCKDLSVVPGSGRRYEAGSRLSECELYFALIGCFSRAYPHTKQPAAMSVGIFLQTVCFTRWYTFVFRMGRKFFHSVHVRFATLRVLASFSAFLLSRSASFPPASRALATGRGVFWEWSFNMSSSLGTMLVCCCLLSTLSLWINSSYHLPVFFSLCAATGFLTFPLLMSGSHSRFF